VEEVAGANGRCVNNDLGYNSLVPHWIGVPLAKMGLTNQNQTWEAFMVYKGHVQNGKVVLEGDIALPEGVAVNVSVVGEADAPTLYERHRAFIGLIDDLPADFAAEHDHYIHGTPKRCE
jgi:hypothetical protein